MNNKKRLLILFYITSLFLPALAHAQAPPPAKVEFEGHTYQLILAPGISWDTAKTAAEANMLGNVPGHLATSTSAAENAFLFGLIAPPILPAFPGTSEAWIGGSQPSTFGNNDGWEWINGEGLIPAPGMSASPYSNWQGGEPNGGNFENHLTLGRYDGVVAGVAGAWNDSNEGSGFIGGYIVEWDTATVVPATSCQLPEVCNPTGVQQVQLPVGLDLQAGDTLTQEIADIGGSDSLLDPRVDTNGNCYVRQELDVFGDGTLILPEYLCGSPELTVIKSSANFADLQEDVVRSEQFPELFFPAASFPCQGVAGEDLQRRGVFAWQPDDRTTVIEQHTLELTNGCGSSRGATKGLSYFVLNLHIDCGISFGSNDPAVLQCFKDLTTDKFSNLDTALDNAKMSLIKPKYGALRSTFAKARNRFGQEKYSNSLGELNTLHSLVNGATFDTNAGNNHQGELLMRIENLQFMIDEKIDP